MDAPKYITQISRDWFENVNRVANIQAGPGIILKFDPDGLRIELDPETFKQWLFAAIKKGMVKNNGMYVSAINGKTLAELGNITLDPYTS